MFCENEIRNVGLGDHKITHISILYSDTRSCTTMAEKGTPDETFLVLKDDLAELGPVVRETMDVSTNILEMLL